jgi:hypothetical protein
MLLGAPPPSGTYVYDVLHALYTLLANATRYVETG